MYLKDYLKSKKISQYRFAKMCGMNESTISLILQGKTFPTPETIKKIELATDGEVKANDFMKQAQDRMVGR